MHVNEFKILSTVDLLEPCGHIEPHAAVLFSFHIAFLVKQENTCEMWCIELLLLAFAWHLRVRLQVQG